MERAAFLVGVCSGTITKAMLGRSLQSRKAREIVEALDRMYDALEPAMIRLARELSQ